MAELGFLSNVQEKALAEMVDEALHLKGLLELIDGYLAKILITVIDDRLLQKLAVKVSDDIKKHISDLVDAGINKDLIKVEELSATLINDLLNVPGLDKDTEFLILKGIIELLVGTIQSWLEK
jgi:hypothetical protein